MAPRTSDIHSRGRQGDDSVDNKIEVLAGKKVELLNTNADNWKINWHHPPR